MSSPIEIREARGVRTLHFGSDWVQGAMRIARPWSLELAYTREMMAGLLLRGNRRWLRSASGDRPSSPANARAMASPVAAMASRAAAPM